jgi:HPt (histidine-containing phosphotransfer) domain-containing protein
METHDAPVPTDPDLWPELRPAAGAGHPVPQPPPGERVVVFIEAELAELIDEYLGNRRADALAIPTELAAEDYSSLRRRGHNLKGDGAAYGFDYLTELGASLEAAAIRRDAETVRGCAVALIDYLSRLDVQPEEA